MKQTNKAKQSKYNKKYWIQLSSNVLAVRQIKIDEKKNWFSILIFVSSDFRFLRSACISALNAIAIFLMASAYQFDCNNEQRLHSFHSNCQWFFSFVTCFCFLDFSRSERDTRNVDSFYKDDVPLDSIIEISKQHDRFNHFRLCH